MRLKINSFVTCIHTYLLGVRINFFSLKRRYLQMCEENVKENDRSQDLSGGKRHSQLRYIAQFSRTQKTY